MAFAVVDRFTTLPLTFQYGTILLYLRKARERLMTNKRAPYSSDEERYYIILAVRASGLTGHWGWAPRRNDANGKIVFTNNRSLSGVGYSRLKFENADAVQLVIRDNAPRTGIMKNSPAGYVFARAITDDTQPGDSLKLTIEYVSPLDRCDREQDYETACKFFEEKYGKEVH